MSPHYKRPSHHRKIADSTRLLRQLSRREHVLLTGRGAAGIWAALKALDLLDEYVLIPANTCYIVLWAVLRSGNKPLLDDQLSVLSGQVSVKDKRNDKEFNHSATEKKIRAIIPCHMYGLPAPMAAICAWAKANDVYVIEDAALALGATVDGRPAGSWGDVSIFSFGLGKIADNQLGGAVLTDDARLAVEMEKLLAETPLWDDTFMALTNQWNAMYWALHQYEAQNPRLTALYPALYDIYGSLTSYQLPPSYWDDLPGLVTNLPDDLAQRHILARHYDELLRPDLRLGLSMLPRPEGSILWRYPLLVTDGHRDELLQYLWENGVQDATRWYPSLRYMTAALAPDIPQPPTPNADSLGDSIINLRLDAGVDRTTVEHTAKLIHSFYDNL